MRAAPIHAGLHIRSNARVHDVVSTRHPLEQGDVLERACDGLAAPPRTVFFFFIDPDRGAPFVTEDAGLLCGT